MSSKYRLLTRYLNALWLRISVSTLTINIYLANAGAILVPMAVPCVLR